MITSERLIAPLAHWPRRLGLVTCAAIAIVAATACGGSDRDDDDDDVTTGQSQPAAGVAPASPEATDLSTAPESASSVASVASTQGAGAVRWGFDSTAGQAPSGFSLARTGSGQPGRWVVRSMADAPSAPNVLAQEDSDRTSYRFPVAVADAPTFKDVSVSVRCKAISGSVDRACGIVWRYIDENNYYLTRANALEDNVCWYYVQNGRRTEVKRVSVRVASGVWHTLRADMRGDHVEVYFNGAKLIDVRDSRFSSAGKVGVWTKADSYTVFDDLTATALKE